MSQAADRQRKTSPPQMHNKGVMCGPTRTRNIGSQVEPGRLAQGTSTSPSRIKRNDDNPMVTRDTAQRGRPRRKSSKDDDDDYSKVPPPQRSTSRQKDDRDRAHSSKDPSTSHRRSSPPARDGQFQPSGTHDPHSSTHPERQRSNTDRQTRQPTTSKDRTNGDQDGPEQIAQRGTTRSRAHSRDPSPRKPHENDRRSPLGSPSKRRPTSSKDLDRNDRYADSRDPSDHRREPRERIDSDRCREDPGQPLHRQDSRTRSVASRQQPYSHHPSKSRSPPRRHPSDHRSARRGEGSDTVSVTGDEQHSSCTDPDHGATQEPKNARRPESRAESTSGRRPTDRRDDHVPSKSSHVERRPTDRRSPIQGAQYEDPEYPERRGTRSSSRHHSPTKKPTVSDNTPRRTTSSRRSPCPGRRSSPYSPRKHRRETPREDERTPTQSHPHKPQDHPRSREGDDDDDDSKKRLDRPSPARGRSKTEPAQKLSHYSPPKSPRKPSKGEIRSPSPSEDPRRKVSPGKPSQGSTSRADDRHGIDRHGARPPNSREDPARGNSAYSSTCRRPVNNQREDKRERPYEGRQKPPSNIVPQTGHPHPPGPVEPENNLENVKISLNIDIQTEPASASTSTAPNNLKRVNPVHINGQSTISTSDDPLGSSMPFVPIKPIPARPAHTNIDRIQPNPIDHDRSTPRSSSSSTRKAYTLRPSKVNENISNSVRTPIRDISSIDDNNARRQHDLIPQSDKTGRTHSSSRLQNIPDDRESGVYSDYRSDLRRDDTIEVIPETITPISTTPTTSIGRKPSVYQQRGSHLPAVAQDQEDPRNNITSRKPAQPHFADENVLPPHEIATPFERKFIHEPNRGFRAPADNGSPTSRSFLLPVINSSRTHVFETQPLSPNRLRRSPSNGNFYLRSPSQQHRTKSFVDETNNHETAQYRRIQSPPEDGDDD